jgi:hypothetical protein
LWEAVVKHHQQKAQLIIVELCRKLQNEKCDEKGDVWAHLSKLRQMREDLALMGEAISDDNYHSIILGSLPMSYNICHKPLVQTARGPLAFSLFIRFAKTESV